MANFHACVWQCRLKMGVPSQRLNKSTKNLGIQCQWVTKSHTKLVYSEVRHQGYSPGSVQIIGLAPQVNLDLVQTSSRCLLVKHGSASCSFGEILVIFLLPKLIFQDVLSRSHLKCSAQAWCACVHIWVLELILRYTQRQKIQPPWNWQTSQAATCKVLI